jgi:transposase
MRPSRTRYGGLDVHPDAIAVADVATEPAAEVLDRGTIGPRQADIEQLVRKLQANATHLVCVYEAGPWGSWRDGYLTQQGQVCWVVAPSLMPNKAGDRVKPDRRDAGQLARRMRSGDLTAISVPAVEDDASGDLQAATFWRTAFWLRHDLRDTGRATWGPAPLRWRADGVCATPAPQSVCQAYGRSAHEHPERRQRLEQALRAQVKAWRRQPVGAALAGRRGVPCTVAVTLVAELGDLTRGENPRHVMKDLGLIPSAYASGERRRQGAITQTGYIPARRALVEGAWV